MASNLRIQDDVRAALGSDGRIKRPELIAVSADEIGTVVLSGAVASPRQHMAAVRDAKRVRGVFEVIADDLKVHPPVGDRLSDDAIRAAVTQQLACDPRVAANHIKVGVLVGRVTLSGRVADLAQRTAAEEDAAGAAGVAAVHNAITVRSAEARCERPSS